jgi:hypothetical protein
MKIITWELPTGHELIRSGDIVVLFGDCSHYVYCWAVDYLRGYNVSAIAVYETAKKGVVVTESHCSELSVGMVIEGYFDDNGQFIAQLLEKAKTVKCPLIPIPISEDESFDTLQLSNCRNI